jgi:competence protein ComEA
MIAVVKRHSRKGKTMKHFIRYYLAAGLLGMTILFAAGCAGQNNTTYSLKGEQPLAEEDTSGGADSTARNTDSDTVLVHICGEVRTPGVYELTADSRICDVLLLAGGFTADADTEAVNMAAGIEDGMQIVIPTETDRTQEMTENSSDRTGEKAAGKTESQLVNINTADKETLMSLPGIGAGKAEAVIAYREAGGVFKDIKDIMLVDGIKEGVYAKIKDKICVK